MTDLGSGVYTFDHEPAEGKSVIVVTRRGAIVVDTGNEPADGAELTDFVRERGLPLVFVILTHGHGDHIFGWPSIGTVDVIATRACRAVVDAQRPLFSRRFGRTPGHDDLPYPTFAADGVLEIDCGDCRLELLPTPGHSVDSQSVWIPDRNVLICGDTVVTSIPVAINEGDGRQLAESCDRLRECEAELIVAGHGAPIRGAAAVDEWLGFQSSYLREIRTRVRSVLAGVSSATADLTPELEARLLEACPFESLIGERLEATRFKMKERHANVVRKIAREEM